jgi:hypothetical protein
VLQGEGRLYSDNNYLYELLVRYSTGDKQLTVKINAGYLLLRSDHSPEPGADDRDVAIASGLADHAMKGVVTAILASASNPDLTLLIANETRQS